MPSEPNRLLALAERAAKAGGQVIRQGIREAPRRAKGAGDYVTDVDRESERVIGTILAADSPFPVVGEEAGGETAEAYWLVDPLDGTTNFVHGFPAVGVSIALIEDGRPVVGVVYSPFLAETYLAVQGQGSSMKREASEPVQLQISNRPIAEGIVATGFPFRDKRLIPRHLAALRRCLEVFEDLRRPGAASLDLAWVASGVFDGFFELGLNSWDVAAGALLVEEAGGRATDWDGRGGYLVGDILAGSPHVHAQLVKIAARQGVQ